MGRIRPALKFRGFLISPCLVVVATLILLATVRLQSAQNPDPTKTGEAAAPPSALNNQPAASTPKEKEESKKSSAGKTETDAAELSALADQLRDELNKLNVNVLPLDVLAKTQKLEKLAKKIKGEAYEH